MNAREDAQLVRACRRGDIGAFEALVARYEGPVFNAAYRIVGDYEEARGVTQNAFVKAYEHLDSYDLDRAFFSWIYRIAVNESINRLRRSRRLDGLDTDIESGARTPEQDVENREMSRHVQRALMTIKTDLRLVLVLRHFMDCSYRDIAEIAGIPEKTVKSRLFTARREMRHALTSRGVRR